MDRLPALFPVTWPIKTTIDNRDNVPTKLESDEHYPDQPRTETSNAPKRPRKNKIFGECTFLTDMPVKQETTTNPYAQTRQHSPTVTFSSLPIPTQPEKHEPPSERRQRLEDIDRLLVSGQTPSPSLTMPAFDATKPFNIFDTPTSIRPQLGGALVNIDSPDLRYSVPVYAQSTRDVSNEAEQKPTSSIVGSRTMIPSPGLSTPKLFRSDSSGMGLEMDSMSWPMNAGSAATFGIGHASSLATPQTQLLGLVSPAPFFNVGNLDPVFSSNASYTNDGENTTVPQEPTTNVFDTPQNLIRSLLVKREAEQENFNGIETLESSNHDTMIDQQYGLGTASLDSTSVKAEPSQPSGPSEPSLNPQNEVTAATQDPQHAHAPDAMQSMRDGSNTNPHPPVMLKRSPSNLEVETLNTLLMLRQDSAGQ
eukprot:TRINITY_DN7022_c0_g1_i3.p1 TRINITY_DN7022_c0_g1~~TRINITY_DN7022_c0_g1_i3.p1  ORF type:complete len:422 (-),score=62.85 TRINITY_DN7022_c0_g1_i3:424-1689(-)